MIAELAELARTMPPEDAPAERGEDSGVVHLASLMAPGLPTPPPPAPQGAGGGEAPPVAVGRWLAIGAVVVVAAAAAGALAARRLPRLTGAPPIMLVPAGAPRLAPAEPALGAEKPSDHGARDPSSLPPTASAATRPAQQPSVVHRTITVKAAVSASVPAAPIPPTVPIAQGTKGLAELMREAVGAAGETPAVATAATTAVDPPGDGTSAPARPSLGAVKSAIGAVLPAAHDCLDADSPVSYANITFRSDGSVASVAISGWAAGKPVESCIRRALSGARVPPFRQATYAVPATIRGN
jgi:hypothetical protein